MRPCPPRVGFRAVVREEEDLEYTISPEVLDATIECPHGFQCLTDGRGHVCAAERAIPGDGVFVPTRRRVLCPYAATCEGGYSCSCPTRLELFRRYGL